MSQAEQVTGLWGKTSASGRDYIQALLRKEVILRPGDKILIFPNSKKTQDNHPDFNMLVVRDALGAGNAQPQPQPQPQPQAQQSFPQAQPQGTVPEDDDDAPF